MCESSICARTKPHPLPRGGEESAAFCYYTIWAKANFIPPRRILNIIGLSRRCGERSGTAHEEMAGSQPMAVHVDQGSFRFVPRAEGHGEEATTSIPVFVGTSEAPRMYSPETKILSIVPSTVRRLVVMSIDGYTGLVKKLIPAVQKGFFTVWRSSDFGSCIMEYQGERKAEEEWTLEDLHVTKGAAVYIVDAGDRNVIDGIVVLLNTFAIVLTCDSSHERVWYRLQRREGDGKEYESVAGQVMQNLLDCNIEVVFRRCPSCNDRLRACLRKREEGMAAVAMEVVESSTSAAGSYRSAPSGTKRDARGMRRVTSGDEDTVDSMDITVKDVEEGSADADGAGSSSADERSAASCIKRHASGTRRVTSAAGGSGSVSSADERSSSAGSRPEICVD